ncbi:MAG: hypothetical protein ABIS86_17630, partial [Streptosporangiaceae bacterium]
MTRSSSKVGVNRWLYPDTVDAEGRIIGSIEDERHVERSLVIYDPVGRRVVRTLATYPGGGNFLATIQASETVTDGRYVVWAEGSSNGEFLDWTLQIFDLKTGVKRLIARNGQFQDGSLLPKEISSLVIKGDRVWWTAGYGSTQKSLGVGVYSAALDGGGATLWRRDTAGLWPIKDGFLAAERVALPGKRDQGSHIVRLDTRGQRIGAILEERTTGFAGNDEFRIWGVPTPESAAEDAEPEEERIRIRTADGALAELPGTLVQESVQGRFAGWQGEGG